MIDLPLDQLSFSIHSMTSADLPAILPLERASYSMPWPESAYRQALSNERADFFFIRHQGLIVGYSGSWQLVDEIHIATIVSHPAIRRRGIGELLLAVIFQRATEKKAKTVTLEVRPSNQAAQNLYTKYGFIKTGLRKNYYPDNGEDGIIMATPALDSAAYQAFLQSLITQLVDRLAIFAVGPFKR